MRWLWVLLLGSACCWAHDLAFEEWRSESGQPLFGTTYELRKPVFVYYSTLFDSYVLEAPGRSTRVPHSVELFEAYGADWRRYDRNHMYSTSEGREDEILGVLYPGTKITIVGMSQKPAVWFDVWVARAQIDDSHYQGVDFQLVGLLRDCSTDQPRANPDYLESVT